MYPYTVITSFSPSGYETYAHAFISSFQLYWPREVELLVAWEGVCPDSSLNGFDLLSTEPAASFYTRHSANRVVQGLQEGERKWGKKARREGYSFTHDAYRFSHKVFAVAAASQYVEGGKLFWIDADVVTQRPVPITLLSDVLPDAYDLCYLPRQGYHSELGFVGYNLERPGARKFIHHYKQQYALDLFLNDEKWDDCNQFDYLVKKLTPRTARIDNFNIAQPFDASVLGKYMRHNKGPRKYGKPGWGDK